MKQANKKMLALFGGAALLMTAACGNDAAYIPPEDRVLLSREDVGQLPPTPTVANGSFNFSSPAACLRYALVGREAVSCVDQQTGKLLFNVAEAPAGQPIYEAKRPIYARKTNQEKSAATPER